MLNAYAIGGLASLIVFGGGAWTGYRLNEASTIRAENAAQRAADTATKATAARLAELERTVPKLRTELENALRNHPAGPDCNLSDDGVRAINEARRP